MGNIAGSLFGAPSSSKSQQSSQTPTSWNTLPQFAQDAFKQGVTGAQALSSDPSLFAPSAINADQNKAAELIRQGYTPTNAQTFGENLSIFQNPFEEQVVQGALGDLRQTGQGLLSDLGSGVSSAGGFGGTRQAVLESDLISQLARQGGNLGAGIRSQGYESAAQKAIDNITQQNALKNQYQTDLGGLGDFLQSFATQTKQAPLEAINYLLSAAQGIPVGGGGTSSGTSKATGDNPGLFGRMSQNFANIAGSMPKGGV